VGGPGGSPMPTKNATALKRLMETQVFHQEYSW
jgi:hypothetical protein